MLLDSILSLSGADRAGLFLGKQGTEAPECPGRARAVGPSTPSSLQVRRLQCRARERAQDPSRWTSPGVPRARVCPEEPRGLGQVSAASRAAGFQSSLRPYALHSDLARRLRPQSPPQPLTGRGARQSALVGGSTDGCLRN